MAKIKLFFVPHAGGSAMGYMVLKRLFHTDCMEPLPLELAGRGQRGMEPCFSNVSDTVKDLYEKIVPQIKDCKYVIFGHSLGTMITYELIQYIVEQGEKPPVAAVFSGRNAPECDFTGPLISNLGDKEFLSCFNKLQALPDELLQNEQILNLMLPVLRADVKMAETYQYHKGRPLPCDVYGLYGKDDILVNQDGMDKWKTYTRHHSEIICMEGGHFYWKEQKVKFAEQINQMIACYTEETEE